MLRQITATTVKMDHLDTKNIHLENNQIFYTDLTFFLVLWDRGGGFHPHLLAPRILKLRQRNLKDRQYFQKRFF